MWTYHYYGADSRKERVTEKIFDFWISDYRLIKVIPESLFCMFSSHKSLKVREKVYPSPFIIELLETSIKKVQIRRQNAETY